MSQALTFNHHSLPYPDRIRAADSVLEFLKIAIDAHITRFSIILLDTSQDSNWFRIELAPGYFWQDWLTAAQSDPLKKDQITAFRSIQTKTPLFEVEDIGGELELFDVVDAITEKSFSALRSAAWYESPLISFPTKAPWDNNPILVYIDKIQDRNGEVERQSGTLVNFHSLQEWMGAKPYYLQARTEGIKNGTELWSQRTRIFPCLGFCGKTQSQFNNWSHPENIYQQVRDSLLVLNNFCEAWRNQTVPDYSHGVLRTFGMNHKVSGESDSVNNHQSKRRARMFYLPDGRPEYFENHIKIGSQYRIHFYPDPQSKTIWIGYVGPHLPL